MVDDGDDDCGEFEFASKYIREESGDGKKESNDNKNGFEIKEFEIVSKEVVEVFGSVGEGGSVEDFKGGIGSFSKEDDMVDDSNEVIESQNKVVSGAKKEFLDNINDESLTVDACDRVNKDWGK
tara:strand:+ start:161 stop:532 length:372 start_codon:yes stop_codon:yes gene_type:complete